MVLALAHDVACAMLHLHSEDLIHGDLKASNVLLTHCNAPLISHGSMGGSTGFIPPGLHTGDAASVAGSSTGSGRLTCAALLAAQQAAQGGRLVAKIADFGLSLSLAPGDTHVSHMHAVSCGSGGQLQLLSSVICQLPVAECVILGLCVRMYVVSQKIHASSVLSVQLAACCWMP